MFLVSVESRYISHFIIGQHEVENVDILGNMFGIAATRNSHHPTLLMPSENVESFGGK